MNEKCNKIQTFARKARKFHELNHFRTEKIFKNHQNKHSHKNLPQSSFDQGLHIQGGAKKLGYIIMQT